MKQKINLTVHNACKAIGCFVIYDFFYGLEMQLCHTVEDHPLWAVHGCIFNIFVTISATQRQLWRQGTHLKFSTDGEDWKCILSHSGDASCKVHALQAKEETG
jgi:hypothetical protein